MIISYLYVLHQNGELDSKLTLEQYV